MSAHELRMSPGRSGPNRRSASRPMMRPSASASSFTVAGRPAETLSIRPFAPGTSAARSVASTTLSTYVKSRDCSPSPKIVIGSARSSAPTKSGITAAYCESGLWRGPKTLK